MNLDIMIYLEYMQITMVNMQLQYPFLHLNERTFLDK